MKYTACEICGKSFLNQNIKRHLKSHEIEKTKRIGYKLDHTDLFCKFCGKEHKTEVVYVNTKDDVATIQIK